MKLPVLAACAFVAMPSLSAADAAMPPDPLTQNLVKVPFTAADLIVRTKTEAPGLNLWRLAGELDALTTEQVRTVAFNCWRPYRRYEGSALYAATAALSLWVDRDLADAAGTLMFIGSWEDMDDSIGDYDLDVESTAGWLWAQLAQRDWKKAKALLQKVSGVESTGQFASLATEYARNLTPAQAAQLVAIFAPKPMEKDSLEGIVEDLMRHLAGTSGLPATRAWAKSLQPATARKLALGFLSKLEDHPPSPPPAPPVFSDDPLGKLRALDVYDGPWIMPFPLYRAVKALSPAEALKLADEAVAHPLEKEGSWLRWMLFMRAAEGDAAAAARLACGPPIGGDAHSLTEAFAWRKDVSAAMKEIGRMPDKALRAAALNGLLTHADISDPAKWLKEIASLNVNVRWAARMFARLGATGKGRETFELAATMDDESAAVVLASAALDTWILTDVRGFFGFLKEKGDADGNGLSLKEFVSVNVESAIYMLRSFGARELLQDDDPVPPKYLNWNDAHWTFFAFEDREITFRYLERHADDPDYESLIGWFADVAVRFEPERAVALSSRAIAAHLARDRKLNVEPDENGESELVADRWAFGTLSRRLVQFWPEKALTIVAPDTDKEWEALCGEMLEQHPQHLAKLVKQAPESVRQSLEKLLTETDSAGRELLLSAKKRKVIAEALRAAK